MSENPGTTAPAEPSGDLTAAPLSKASRIDSLDIVRGFAVLGILVMNMVVFHQPFYSLMVPTLMGEQTSGEMTTWFWTILLVEGSMRALFGMLFGAGVYLFFSRLEERFGKSKARSLHLSRSAWLVGFGLIDSYLFLWLGDVLFLYGLIGLLLWTARDLKVRTLLALAAICLLISFGLKLMNQASTNDMLAEQARIEALAESGEALSEEDQTSLAEINDAMGFIRPSPESMAYQIKITSSGPMVAKQLIWPINMILQSVYLIFFSLWDSGIAMLLGMALMKSGGFTGAWSTKSYGALAIVGLGIALPWRAFNLMALEASGFDLSLQVALDLGYDVHRILLGLGYFGLLMVLIRKSLMPLAGPLSAVGRMALTNYLTHSIIALCVFIIGGQYGAWSRVDVFLFTVAVWMIQLIYSPLWLARFRYGPAEWAWRSLTYRQFQKFRKS